MFALKIYGTAILFLASTAVLPAAPPNAKWRAEKLPKKLTLETLPDQQESGRRFDRFRVSSAEDFRVLRLVRSEVPAKVIPDFQASVEVNSTITGISLALRTILPNQLDPRTNRPLITYVAGTSYQKPGEWQTLTASASRDAIQATIRALRTELKQSEIDVSEMYFDGCVLIAEVHRGEGFIDVGPTEWGPVVAPERVIEAGPAEAATTPSNGRPAVYVERERLVSGDRSVFLRLVPDHGESIAVLKSLRINAVWVSDANAGNRIRNLQSEGFLVLATPPHPQFDPGDFSAPIQGLVPLEQAYADPSIWYLGTRIDGDQLQHLLAWAREVRSADRKLRRPLMADVVTGAGIASRQVDIVAQSQQLLNGRTSFGTARNESYVQQNASAQLGLPWEWLQTSPSVAVESWRQRIGVTAIHPEPEQILMQVIASLSAGMKGVGFWKTQSLDAENSRTAELRKSIALANIYVDLLKPALTDGRVEGHLPITTDINSPQSAGISSGIDYTKVPNSADGAVIRLGGTSVILAAHWDRASQFVPQSMYFEDAVVKVAATETASAWQVTPTGIRGVRRERTAGGLRVRIRDFDQNAIVLVSSAPEARQGLEQRIFANAERAAVLMTEVATQKVDRTDKTCEEVDAILRSQTDRSGPINSAHSYLAAADDAVRQKEFSKARVAAFAAMRIARKLQNQYWRSAVENLSSPTASPHTISFSSLPDHWRMVSRIRTDKASPNLVPSGDFESLKLISQSKWKPIAPQDDSIRNSVVIVEDDRGSNMALRLRAWSARKATSAAGPVLLLQAPEVEAKSGDIFEIKLRVRIGSTITTANPKPLLIFDGELGPEMAVSPELQPSWRSLRMYRQASTTGPFRVWLALQDVSEVFIDDFSVVRYSSVTQPATAPRIGLQAPVFSPGPGKPSRVQGAGYSIPVNP